MKACRVFFGVLASIVSISVLQAQVTSVISRVTAQQGVEKQPLSVAVEFTQATTVERVLLKYRRFGESEYKELEMLLAGRSATVSIPDVDVAPPYIEYYVWVSLGGGKIETYPLENPDVTPQKAIVTPVNPKDLEVRILSPEKGEAVAFEDLVIALSLFYASDDVNRGATRLYLDGINITPQAVFAEDVIMYSPKNFPQQLNLGLHFLKIELRDKRGNLYHTIESSFNLSTAAAIAAEEARFRAGVDGQLEYRRERVSSVITNYTRGELRLNGTFKSLRFGSNLNLTNEEKSNRQPQNRLLGWAQTDWLRLEVGDAYPRLPSLIVSGKRVRGITGNLSLGFLNVDVSYGQTVRPIDGTWLKDTTFADTSAWAARPTNTLPISGLKYEVFEPGTYLRSFLAVRPSFGSGENFQLGFTYLTSKDDKGSIRRGTFPQENMVAGTDLLIAFDDQRLKLETQASVCLINTNIVKGSFTKADFDSIRKRDPQQADDLEKLSNIASKFITVNEYLFPANPTGEGLPGVSFEGILSLNYFNNFIRANFFRRGDSYMSFGNEFLQTDIQGFNVSDRIRLFQNRVLLSLSYEQKSDNIGDRKAVTTDFATMNSSLTLFPAANWPAFTVGYGMNTRKNDANVNIAAQKSLVADDQINRIFFQTNYDFTLGARNNFALAINVADKTDKTFNKRDQTNNNISAVLTSIYRIPLQTTVSLTLSQNKSQAMMKSYVLKDSLAEAKFNYTTIAFNLQYRMFQERLRLALTAAPSFGDLQRTLGQVGLDFAANDHHNFIFQLDFIKNKDMPDDMITSLVYRFNF